MSGAAKGGASTSQAVVQDPLDTSKSVKAEPKVVAPLEEDDEFEDFPVEGMFL